MHTQRKLIFYMDKNEYSLDYGAIAYLLNKWYFLNWVSFVYFQNVS